MNKDYLLFKNFIAESDVQGLIDHYKENVGNPQNYAVSNSGRCLEGDLKANESVYSRTVHEPSSLGSKVMAKTLNQLRKLGLEFQEHPLSSSLNITYMNKGYSFAPHLDDLPDDVDSTQYEMVRFNILLQPAKNGGKFHTKKRNVPVELTIGDAVVFVASETMHGVTAVKEGDRIVSLFFVVAKKGSFTRCLERHKKVKQ